VRRLSNLRRKGREAETSERNKLRANRGLQSSRRQEGKNAEEEKKPSVQRKGWGEGSPASAGMGKRSPFTEKSPRPKTKGRKNLID